MKVSRCGKFATTGDVGTFPVPQSCHLSKLLENARLFDTMRREYIVYDFPMSEKLAPVLPSRKRRKEAMGRLELLNKENLSEYVTGRLNAVNFKAEEVNGGILIKPAYPEDDEQFILNLAKEAKESPMTDKELAQESKRLMAHWSQKAEELGIKSEEDLYRYLDE